MSTRKRSQEDFDREIRAHIETETDRLIDEGMAPDAARVAARRRFGNVTIARERFYEAGRLVWLDHVLQDLRCAARNMRRYPVASLVAVLSLAAGMGATTVTLTIRDVIFRKLPAAYARPEQLSRIQIGSPENPIRPLGNPVPIALYASWRDTLGSSIAAWTSPGEREVRTADRMENARIRAVTPEASSVCSASRPCSGWASRHPPLLQAGPRRRSSATASGSRSSTGAPMRSARSSGLKTSPTPSSASCRSVSGSPTWIRRSGRRSIRGRSRRPRRSA